jgi:hypothetical protein
MAKAKNTNNGNADYTGCYGPRLSYTEVQDFLNTAFKADEWSEQNNPGERFSTCIFGQPGVAKTTCINSFENMPVVWRGKQYSGYKVVYVPLAQYEEMGDLLGLPARHVCMASKVKVDAKEAKALKANGKKIEERSGDLYEITEEWVPEQCVEGYKDLGWDFLPQKGIKTLCAPPAWVPQEEGPTILLFDDWNRASLRIIKGVMQLLQTYGTVTWKLPAGSHIVLTGNPDDQDFQVTSLDKAIITRLRNVTMRFDVKEWSVWAQKVGLDGRGITWGLQNFEMMLGKEQTNPRTLAEVFRMTKTIGDLNEKKNEILFRRIAGSLLDEDTVNAMVIYFQKDVGLVAEPEKILNGDTVNGKSVADYVAALMSSKNGGERRTDIVGVLCDRLFAYIHQETVEPTQKAVKNFQDFVVLDPIPEDIRYGLVTRICKCKENTRLTRWIIGNKKLSEILKVVFQAD